MSSGERPPPILVWQRSKRFAGEDIHRLAHRRLRPLLIRRLGERAPEVRFETGPAESVVARCGEPLAALVLPAFRDDVPDSLALVRTLAERTSELPVLVSGWGAEPGYLELVGGDEPLRHPRLALARGEAEEALVDALVELLGCGGGFPRQRLMDAGLALPDGAGGWLSRGRFRQVGDLAALPCPYRSGELRPADADGMVLLEIGRGCLYRCRFCLMCNYPPARPRHLPVERIRADVAHAVSLGAERLGLLCSGLNYDVEVLETVADALEAFPPERRPRVDSTLHASLFDERRLRAIARIPWSRIIIGLQSTHPEALRSMGRKVDLERFRAAIEELSTVHRPTVEVILGLPGDTLQGFNETLRYVLSLPAEVEVYHLRLDPGSQFLLRREELGLEADWSRQGRVIRTPSFSEQEMDRAVRGLRALGRRRRWPFRATRLAYDFDLIHESRREPDGVRPSPAAHRRDATGRALTGSRARRYIRHTSS